VGLGDLLRSLKYYLEQLHRFIQLQEEAWVEIPFTFHAEETLGDGTAVDMNPHDAILLGKSPRLSQCG